MGERLLRSQMTDSGAKPAISKILCPVVLYVPEERALLEYAARLAAPLGAEVHVLHVFDLPGYLHPHPDSPAVKRFSEYALRERRLELDNLLASVGAEVALEGELRPGVPHRRIVEEVEQLGIDLIVMHTHHRRGIRRALLGSVAERVLRTSPVPVLTVPLGEDSCAPPRSILVPYDFSDPSRSALERASELRERLGVDVTVLHVLAPPPAGDGVSPPWLLAEELGEYRESLRRELYEDVERAFGPSGGASTRLEEGEVVERVLAAREELGADLIIVGGSGKGAVERFLLGSVTVGLLRQSHVPVLTMVGPSVP